MNEQIDWEGFIFEIEVDEYYENSIHIRVLDPNLPVGDIAFYLELKGLWTNGLNFNEGDYFQYSILREVGIQLRPQFSYGALVHNFLINNAAHFPNIKNIYSTSLEGNDEDCFITVDAIRFWNRQVENGIATLVEDRYKIHIND